MSFGRRSGLQVLLFAVLKPRGSWGKQHCCVFLWRTCRQAELRKLESVFLDGTADFGLNGSIKEELDLFQGSESSSFDNVVTSLIDEVIRK